MRNTGDGLRTLFGLRPNRASAPGTPEVYVHDIKSDQHLAGFRKPGAHAYEYRPVAANEPTDPEKH